MSDLFLGFKRMDVDDKGRVFMPSSFRTGKFASDSSLALVCNYNFVISDEKVPCLSLVAFDDWLKLVREEKLFHNFLSVGSRVEMKNNSRFQIPKDYRDFAKIGVSEGVYFIGEGDCVSLYNEENGLKLIDYVASKRWFNRLYEK